MSRDKKVDENFQGIIVAVGAGHAEAQPHGKKKTDKKTVTQRQDWYELCPIYFVFVRQQAA